MERFIMTKKDLKKYRIIQDCIDGIYTVPQAAKLLNLSDRQIQRLKKEVKEKGPQGVIHKNRGKRPNNAIEKEKIDKIIKLKNTYEYEKANFTHFKELLEEYEDIKVSYSCLYSNLRKNGIKSPRKHKKVKLHHRRKRKSYFGELIQTDGTPFDWFGIGKRYSIHGYIDDATGIPLGLYMCESECLLGYLEITRQMLTNYGIPENIYSDKFSVFFPPSSIKLTIEEELRGEKRPKTQFFKILEELNINLIAANSSQAKGRIERLWNTLQDRLVTEFRVHKITSIDQANEFFPNFIKSYGKRFGVKPEKNETKFIKLPKYIDLDSLLTTQFTRVIDNAGCFSFYNKKFQVIADTIPPKSKITVLMSKKIGIKIEFKGKKYDVITCENLPAHNSSKELNAIFKERQVENILFATYLLSQNAKEKSPLLVSG